MPKTSLARKMNFRHIKQKKFNMEFVKINKKFNFFCDLFFFQIYFKFNALRL